MFPQATIITVQLVGTKMGLRTFSSTISTGGSTRTKTQATGTGPGFTARKKAALVKQGFSKTEVTAINKLKKTGPGKGFRRITNPKNLPEGSNATEATKTFGFVDVNRITGKVDPVIPRR